MSAKTLQLEIVTPEKITYSEPVEFVALPGSLGELGVLPGHMAMVVALKPGELRFHKAGQIEILAVSGGFAEITAHKVVVLAETAELAGEIDATRAQMQVAAKGEKLKGAQLSQEEMIRIQGSMIKEMVRMKVAEKRKRR